MNLLYKFRKSIVFFLRLLIVATVVSLFLGFWHTYYSTASFQFKGNYLVIVVYILMLLVFMSVFGAFKYGTAKLRDLIYSTCLATIGTNFFTYFELCLIARKILSPIGIILASVLQILFIFIGCYVTNVTYYTVNTVKNILAITDGSEMSAKLIRKMQRISNRFKIERGISPSKGMDAIKAAVENYDAVLVCDDFDKITQEKIITYCYSIGKKVYVQPSTADIIMSDSSKIQISDSPLIVCKTRGLTNEQKAIKRLMDIVISAIGVIIAGPIMAAVAIAIKLNDGGPIIFKQNRVTENGKIFNVYKFRSMIVDADKEGVKKATDGDDRITAVGKVIRPLRLDELPQLFNILFGSMSLVGPRPERTENVHEYTKLYPEFGLRHKVKGGLTGYAQIYGKYNTSPLDKLHMDLMYIENYSILLDLKLIIMTFKILFVKESTEGFDEQEAYVTVKKPEENQTEEGEN